MTRLQRSALEESIQPFCLTPQCATAKHEPQPYPHDPRELHELFGVPETMDMDVEINLKIPRPKTPALDDHGYPIDTSAIRFTKTITVSSVPKEGALLPMSTDSGQTFEAAVIRSDWHDSREMFIVYCKYAQRSIPQALYDDLMRAADWTAKPLL